uniref:U19-Saltitoxin-Pre1d_1 n=1 Tax=Phidippus regius TaxID=1905328 RepID=A0A482ZC07_9ARAC
MKSFLCIAVLSFCLAVCLAKTKCEEHRERELKSNTKGKLVPKCDSNGDYEALQCFEGSPLCTCWRPDGTQITEPSRKIKTCVCHAHRDRILTRSKYMVGIFVPSCKKNGAYSRKQCHGSIGSCWCADENGNRISDPVKFGELNC